jgi:hypothetical protein
MNARILENMNGAAIVPALICTWLFARYLLKEGKRREKRLFDWFHFPPGMDLVLAMVFFNTMVLGERMTKWVWRRFLGADDFRGVETFFMFLFGAGIVVALLCKIRALTKPDYGNGPWAWSAVATAVAIFIMLVSR